MTNKEKLLQFEEYFRQLTEEQKDNLLMALQELLREQMGYAAEMGEAQENPSEDMDASLRT